MAQAHQVEDHTAQVEHLPPARRSPLTPGLAAAAKRFGLRPDAVKRHEEYVELRQRQLEVAKLERDASKAKYEALKGTVDQLVAQIQDVAQTPNKAQAGDIQNIRTLLVQATRAMERQQVELKGIRARTQRMERAAIKAGEVHGEVATMQREISGYQKALYQVRTDMACLVDLIEGEGGLKDLAGEVRVVRQDLDETRTRTNLLEQKSEEQSARTLKLEQDVETLRTMVESNMHETAGVAGALLTLREEMGDLRKRVGRYIIDQIKFVRG